MHRGRRPRRALVGSGIVAAAVVMGGGGPAPGQVPLVPEVTYVDGYPPETYSYEDCDDVVHLEQYPYGEVYIELAQSGPADVSVGITFTGSLADDIVDPPAEIVVPAGDSFGGVVFELDDYEVGDLTITIEPGVGYLAGPEDTLDLEVTDEVVDSASCHDDLDFLIEEGADRQTIAVGEQPDPLGFFEGSDEGDGGEGEGSTVTTESGSGTGGPAALALQAVPGGVDTPVANGSLPPGLTYEDDEWAGAATTPGTYAFDVRLCFSGPDGFARTTGRAAAPTPQAFPDVVCFGTVDVEIVVEAAAVTPPPAIAPPARPVRTDARFTG